MKIHYIWISGSNITNDLIGIRYFYIPLPPFSQNSLLKIILFPNSLCVQYRRSVSKGKVSPCDWLYTNSPSVRVFMLAATLLRGENSLRGTERRRESV